MRAGGLGADDLALAYSATWCSPWCALSAVVSTWLVSPWAAAQVSTRITAHKTAHENRPRPAVRVISAGRRRVDEDQADLDDRLPGSAPGRFVRPRAAPRMGLARHVPPRNLRSCCSRWRMCSSISTGWMNMVVTSSRSGSSVLHREPWGLGKRRVAVRLGQPQPGRAGRRQPGRRRTD
jgi:hypothetical protein